MPAPTPHLIGSHILSSCDRGPVFPQPHSDFTVCCAVPQFDPSLALPPQLLSRAVSDTHCLLHTQSDSSHCLLHAQSDSLTPDECERWHESLTVRSTRANTSNLTPESGNLFNGKVQRRGTCHQVLSHACGNCSSLMNTNGVELRTRAANPLNCKTLAWSINAKVLQVFE